MAEVIVSEELVRSGDCDFMVVLDMVDRGCFETSQAVLARINEKYSHTIEHIRHHSSFKQLLPGLRDRGQREALGRVENAEQTAFLAQHRPVRQLQRRGRFGALILHNRDH